MKINKKVLLLTVTVAVSFLVGCQSNAIVVNTSTTNSNSNQTAKSGEASKPATPAENKANTSNAPVDSEKVAPVYTDITEKGCKTTKKNEQEEWMTQICEGVGGYKLEVFEGDLRSSINVVAPNGKKSELDFQQVSGAFSTLGEKAEWRVEKKDGKDVPTALIVRFNASKGDDDSKNDSFLIVSKISPEKSCITDVVKPTANANEEARKLAESAETKPCKTNF
jgi:hypothetical protein